MQRHGALSGCSPQNVSLKKKILCFFLRKPTLKKFPIFWETAHFLAQVRKNKKIYPEKISYTPGKWNFLTLILKSFLYFRKRKPRKNFLYFVNRKLFLYIGKEKPKKILYISGNKNFLYFTKQKLLKTCYISENRTFRARKSKVSYTFPDKEAKFSKLKYFFIIIIKRFFLVL